MPPNSRCPSTQDEEDEDGKEEEDEEDEDGKEEDDVEEDEEEEGSVESSYELG